MAENISFGSRLKHAWNAFFVRDPPAGAGDAVSYSYRPDRVRFSRGNERTIMASVLNRIAVDCSQIKIVHAKLDDNGRYLEDIDSGFNRCVSLEANLDQTGRAFLQDAYLSMMDEGCIALVPTDWDTGNTLHGDFDIRTLRVGKVLEWHPDTVRLEVYNEHTGRKQEIFMPKRMVAIVENPLYAVMNEPNSTLRRLTRKLAILDAVDEQIGSGKLDMIIQVPYTTRSDLHKQQAKQRIADIQEQLSGSRYGIAYMDISEKVIQLNRSLDNNLLKQVEYLQNIVWGQIGMTQSILDGSADEKTKLNYQNQTLEPMVSALADECRRKFLNDTARHNGESILYFSDPFKLVPVGQIAEIADKFTRNEILTSNEVRQIVGMKPSNDPRADELRNSNISESKNALAQRAQIKEENQDGNA